MDMNTYSHDAIINMFLKSHWGRRCRSGVTIDFFFL